MWLSTFSFSSILRLGCAFSGELPSASSLRDVLGPCRGHSLSITQTRSGADPGAVAVAPGTLPVSGVQTAPAQGGTAGHSGFSEDYLQPLGSRVGNLFSKACRPLWKWPTSLVGHLLSFRAVQSGHSVPRLSPVWVQPYVNKGKLLRFSEPHSLSV